MKSLKAPPPKNFMVPKNLNPDFNLMGKLLKSQDLKFYMVRR